MADPTLTTLVKTVHVLGAATWFGATLLWWVLLRRLPPTMGTKGLQKVLRALLKPVFHVTEMAEILTILSGVGLLLLFSYDHTWLASDPRGLRMSAAIALAIVAFFIGVVWERHLGEFTEQEVGKGKELDASKLPWVGQLLMLELLLLLTIIVMMVAQNRGL